MNFLHTDQQSIQQSSTIFLLGSAISILFYGPISDHVGRKPVIIFGVFVASMSNFLSTTTCSISSFLLFRFAQGIGCGACVGMGRIIAADIMPKEKLAATGIYFSTLLSLSTILAPIIGSYMQTTYGWQSNFFLLGLILLMTLVVIIFVFEETNTHIIKENVSFNFLNVYQSLLKQKTFIGCCLLTGIARSVNIVYITLSAFIFQNEFHFSALEFGWLTASVGIISLIARLVLAKLIALFSLHKALEFGSQLLIISGGVTLALLIFDRQSLYSILGASVTAMSGAIFIGGITLVLALSPQKHHRGSAGALFGSLQMLISSILASVALSFKFSGSSVLGLFYFLTGILSLYLFYKCIRQ